MRSHVLFLGVVFAMTACAEDETTQPATPSGPAATSPTPPAPSSEPSSFTVGGDRFFPEGIAAAADGRMFIGSLGTGEIAVRAPKAEKATTFIAAGTAGMKGTVGIAVDTERNLLWACAADLTFQSPGAIKSFDLTTGEPRSSVDFPGRAICNDLTIGPRGDLYMTDSFGGAIMKLAAGENQVKQWSKPDAFAGAAQGDHSVNGIVWDGRENLYAVRTDRGEMFRIGIEQDGSAGTPVKIALDRPLDGPDGIVRLDRMLLVTEHSGGRLARVTFEGDGDTAHVETLRDALVEPTTLAVVGTDAWVVEGQLAPLFDPSAPAPKLPFRVQRVPLVD